MSGTDRNAMHPQSALPELEPAAQQSALQDALEQALSHTACLSARALGLELAVLLYGTAAGGAAALWREGALRPSAECAPFLPLLPHLAYPERAPLSGAQVRTLEELAAQADPGRRYLALPLCANGACLGTLLLGRAAPWTGEARAQAVPAGELLALALACREWLSRTAFQNWLFNEMMDNMNACLYVTDVETDQILFMNRYMRELFGLERPEGLTCWQVLQSGLDRRCSFCPIPMLQAGGEAAPTCIWEERNTKLGRVYENHDSLMRWYDGRTVHLQQSIDITETKRLFRAATVDELTGVLNRRAGKEAFRALLERAAAGGRTLTVCMLDINDLKTVNDTLGHRAGDGLIAAVAHACLAERREEDCLFRLGGDEFIFVLADAGLVEASRRIAAVQGRLEQAPAISGVDLRGAFCFGLLELPWGHGLSLDDIWSTVDGKLYEQKRARHIRRAEGRLCQRDGCAPEAEFAYDKDLLYDALVNSTDDYLYISNMRTGTFRYPRRMVEEFGLPGEVVPNAAAVWGARIHPDDKAAFLEANQEIADGRATGHCVEYRAKNRKGEWVWLRCRGRLERDASGAPALFAGIITNLGQKNRIDHLTGLPNKTQFEAEAQALLERASADAPLAGLLFNMDDLKRLNSLYDWAFGDEVIRITAQKLQTLLPPNGLLFRLDGDEFGVLLRGAPREAARAFYNRVQASLGHQQTLHGGRFYCTVSCGCALAPEDGTDFQRLMKYAHFALDHAKAQGKNRLCFFSPTLLPLLERRLELTELLRQSVEDGFRGFELYYQPVFTDGGARLAGTEALCRWQCGKYGRVGPDEFIPLLESSGLILPVGRWVVRRALDACVRWQRRIPGFLMAVNLSYLQLEDPTFPDFLARELERCGQPPVRLIAELTESYLASNVARLPACFQRLRELGVLISMDDFGTGYSSLGVLKEYPVDIVKIDRTFIKGVHSSAFDRAFLEFVVELCHKLGVCSCLEGIETAQELEVAASLALDYLQGFHLSRPISAGEFEARYLP